MLLARRQHTAGNRRRYTLDYTSWLPCGDSVASATASTASLTAVVNGITVLNNRVLFFVSAGAVNETFTVAVQIVTSRGEIKNDTMEFTVAAP